MLTDKKLRLVHISITKSRILT